MINSVSYQHYWTAHKFVVAISIIMLCNQTDGQSLDSVHQLKTITVNAERMTFNTRGMKIISIDSSTLENYSSDDAAVLLAEQTPVTVKTYGQGGLATMSIRGTLASQAGVYWNGLNINQPNLGQTDLSLVPLFFFESVALQLGGSSALFGSGNIGGGLHLENNQHFSSPFRLKASSGIGSFHEFDRDIKVSYGERNIAFSFGMSAKNQENDFPYTNAYHQRERQKNASVWNNNILQQLDLRTGRNSILSAGLWLLNSDRNLPSPTIASPVEENQQDQSVRTYIKWVSESPLNALIFRSGWLVEKMHYINPQELINAHYLTRTGVIEGEYRRKINRKTILGLQGSTGEDIATIDSYAGGQQQVRGSISAYAQNELTVKGWGSTLSIRKEWIQGYEVPLCPSLGAEGRLNKFLSAKIHVSRNFRAPTLNDRFWQPGGNENLKPETSWSSEAGINWESGTTDGRRRTAISVTSYYTMIKDLILWTPGRNNIWSPENIQEVFSRGLEFDSRFAIKINKVTCKLHAAYSYTPSTFNLNESGTTPLKGNQLEYIPLHNGVAGLRLDIGSSFINWEQSLTGKRYILRDNSEFLDGYSLGNITAGSIFILNNLKISLKGEIRNLFDTSYQAIQYYAVPGRSYRIILSLIH